MRSPIAVVLVTLNSERWLRGCLDSLRAMERPPAEIVAVDNGSSDGTAALLAEAYPEVRLVALGRNTGFCRATNLGIGATSSPFVLALNPDTTLDGRFLEELLPAFDDPRVGIACGKLLRFGRDILDSAGQKLGRSRQPVDRGYGTPDRGEFEIAEEVFGACGAAALYRREMLAEIAGPGGEIFDEAYFAYYEDLDVAWRARRFGWKAVYRPRALGRHARGGTTDRPGPSRGGALLSRGSELRYHIVKNRYLAILRNDRPWDYLRDFPFIAGRDAATFLMLLVTSPGVLARLWRERRVFGRARELRRLDCERIRNKVTAGGAA